MKMEIGNDVKSKLPPEFVKKMSLLLGESTEAFLTKYDEERQYGLRINTLKVPAQKIAEMPFGLRKIEWTGDGYYYDADTAPGRHPYHDAGAYYIQEPSAMAVAQLLDVKPGDRVLDLCAAPGGKSTQIASKLDGRGILISNEINTGRAKILSGNIERMGVRNAAVLNHDSETLSKKFTGFFNKILVDAPCSGEGMFRKDENAISEWSPSNVQMCSVRQREILENASRMLAPGGTLVYSTCTFSPEEDENVIAGFLAEHRDYTVKPCKMHKGFDFGHPEWVREGEKQGIENAIRLWPHLLGGEGHFAAALQKSGRIETNEGNTCKKTCEIRANKRDIELYHEFEEEYLRHSPEETGGMVRMFGEQVYLVPEIMPDFDGLKVLRAGLHLGSLRKNRFEPSHSLAMALKPCEAENVYNMNPEEARRYIHGETIEPETDNLKKGWVLMLVDGFSIGWGKYTTGIIKNHYPKGLRKHPGRPF